jgi:hypothetical protein
LIPAQAQMYRRSICFIQPTQVPTKRIAASVSSQSCFSLSVCELLPPCSKWYCKYRKGQWHTFGSSH